jgi:hypothetical protein
MNRGVGREERRWNRKTRRENKKTGTGVVRIYMRPVDDVVIVPSNS